MTYNNEHNIKSYKFRLGDNDKYRKNHDRIFKKTTKDEGRINKIKPDARGKKIIWKER